MNVAGASDRDLKDIKWIERKIGVAGGTVDKVRIEGDEMVLLLTMPEEFLPAFQLAEKKQGNMIRILR